MTSRDWTQDRTERLKRLWLNGLSASQLARKLGGVSRSAVLGKLHRLGLTGRGGAPRPLVRKVASGPTTTRKAAPTQSRAAARVAVSKPSPAEPGLVRDLAALGPGDCRWPIGDPASPDFSFCGRPTLRSEPYCPGHDRAAHARRRKTLRDPDAVRCDRLA